MAQDNYYKLMQLNAIPAFLLLLFWASASSARTTVIIDQNWHGASLRNCQDYMMAEAVLHSGTNGGTSAPGLSRREIDLNMCCYKLIEMEAAAKGSTCSGVEEAVRRLMADQKLRGEGIMTREEDWQNAWDVAEELPSKCGLGSPSRCRFSSRLSSSWL